MMGAGAAVSKKGEGESGLVPETNMGGGGKKSGAGGGWRAL